MIRAVFAQQLGFFQLVDLSSKVLAFVLGVFFMLLLQEYWLLSSQRNLKRQVLAPHCEVLNILFNHQFE